MKPIALADPLCGRCRLVLAQEDVREWAAAGDELICPHCVSEYDRTRGVVEAEVDTHRAHLAARHEHQTNQTLRVLLERYRQGDRFVVLTYLRAMVDQRPFGPDAVASVAWSALAYLAETDAE